METGRSQQEASRESLEMEVSSKLQVSCLSLDRRDFLPWRASMIGFTDIMSWRAFSFPFLSSVRGAPYIFTDG